MNTNFYTLKNAQKKQDEFYLDADNSESNFQRPVFHFSTPVGWCNDPNGFSQFNDKIHLFFQYHPYSTQWGPMHWGHVISDDMLNWELLPVALAPDSSADYKGCFSGTALEHNGKHILAYTGVINNGSVDIQHQCIAEGDGISYKKFDSNPVITASNIPFEYNNEHFRDPKIWKKDNLFYMACVIKQKNDCGALILFESQDLHKWQFKGILDSSKDGLSKMWECPDVSNIDGQDILILSPQEIKVDSKLGFHDGNNSVYISGKFDYENCSFIRDFRPENNYTAALIDYGIDFYAPETTRLSDGRTIMIGWMQVWESFITPPQYKWSGMMTLPREVSYKNGRLYQRPVRELEKLKKNRRDCQILQNENCTVFSNQNRQFEIDLQIEQNNQQFSSKNETVTLYLGSNKQKVKLEIDLGNQTILFDRSKSFTPGNISMRKEQLRLASYDPASEKQPLNLKIICDTCSLEVFINDGIMTFTNSFFFTDEKSDLKIENSSSRKISFTLFQISS